MKISTKGRYAIRFMADLANCESDMPVKIKDVANRQQISEKYLEQIASILCKAKLIKSIRGPKGGYVLNVCAEDCTVGMVLRATENSFELVPCVNANFKECEMQGDCSVRKLWSKLDSSISALFDSVTLQDILDESIELKCEL